MIIRTDAQLIADVRLRSDLGDSQFRTDPQLRQYLNNKNRQLTSKLLAIHGADFLSTTDTISVVADTALYDLPSDCFKPKYFRVTIGGARVKIPRATTDEIDVDTGSADWSAPDVIPRHRVVGDQVRFIPTPKTSYTVTVHYIHTAIAFDGADDSAIEALSDSADYLQGYWNYEEWTVIAASIMVKNDQEEDSRALTAELDRLWMDIEKIADDRTDTEPERVRDRYGPADLDDYFEC